MVEGLPAIEGERAFCIGTLSGDIGGVEGLRERKKGPLADGTLDVYVVELVLVHFKSPPWGHRCPMRTSIRFC